MKVPTELNAWARFKRLDAVELARSDDGDVRVGRNLYGCHASGKQDQRAKKDRKAGDVRGRNKTGCACSHGHQPKNHRLFVPKPIDAPTARIRKHKVRREEGELYQHRLHIVQLEDTLEMRDDDVVQTCEKSHHEEQDHGHRHRMAIRYRAQLVLRSRPRYLLRVECQASSFPKATQIRLYQQIDKPRPPNQYLPLVCEETALSSCTGKNLYGTGVIDATGFHSVTRARADSCQEVSSPPQCHGQRNRLRSCRQGNQGVSCPQGRKRIAREDTPCS